jgi:hypothetical protein
MRAGAAAKRKIGRPPNVVVPAPPASWDNADAAAQVRAVLNAFDDVPPIDDQVRLTLQRWLYRQDKFFGGGGAGQITMVLRVFLESDVNRDALIEPILSAVSWVKDPAFAKHGLSLLDAFDQIKLTELLATMRGLHVFPEGSIGSYLSVSTRNKVLKILEPAKPKPAKARSEPKPPLSVTRIPAIEANIAIGIKLQALRAQIKSNRAYGEQVRARFDIDAAHAVDCARVAKAFAARPEIYRAASWIALIELSSPKMSPSVRQAIEAKILAGESVTAPQIRKARGPLKRGSLKRKLEPARMAA